MLQCRWIVCLRVQTKWKVGKMFTLDVNVPKINAILFVQGIGIVADIEIWRLNIGHANVQRLKAMQS